MKIYLPSRPTRQWRGTDLVVGVVL